jgi:hypothetical protein
MFTFQNTKRHIFLDINACESLETYEFIPFLPSISVLKQSFITYRLYGLYLIW